MLALIIFLLTLFGILRRPFGFGVWVYSSVGAGFVLAFKLVSVGDLRFIFALIWDSSLTLIGLIIISLCLEALGFFERLIFYTLKLCQNAQFTGKIQPKTPNLSAQNGAFLPINSNTTPNLSANSNIKANLSANAQSTAPNSAPPNTLIINTRLLFITLCLLCALCSSVLANDGAVLIFTPLVLGLFLRAKKADLRLIIAFLFAIGFICDTASNPLIISNLTNIITANFHQIAFADFAKTMFLPNLLAFLCALSLFLLVFGKALRTNLNFRSPSTPKLSNALFAFYLTLLALFVASFFISRYFALPFSANCLIFALFLLAILWRKSPKKAAKAIKNAPFSIIIFVFGLFVVVFALTKMDLQPFLNAFFESITQNSLIAIFGTGTASALGASVFNNLPMVLFGNLAINDFAVSAPNLAGELGTALEHTKQALIYANLLGCNIGSKLTPIGSLCTLLWLTLLAKRGVKFGFKQYFAYSLIFALPVLLAGLFGLWLVL